MPTVASSAAASSLGLDVCLRMPGSRKAYDTLSAVICRFRAPVRIMMRAVGGVCRRLHGDGYDAVMVAMIHDELILEADAQDAGE